MRPTLSSAKGKAVPRAPARLSSPKAAIMAAASGRPASAPLNPAAPSRPATAPTRPSAASTETEPAPAAATAPVPAATAPRPIGPPSPSRAPSASSARVAGPSRTIPAPPAAVPGREAAATAAHTAPAPPLDRAPNEHTAPVTQQESPGVADASAPAPVPAASAAEEEQTTMPSVPATARVPSDSPQSSISIASSELQLRAQSGPAYYPASQRMDEDRGRAADLGAHVKTSRSPPSRGRGPAAAPPVHAHEQHQQHHQQQQQQQHHRNEAQHSSRQQSQQQLQESHRPHRPRPQARVEHATAAAPAATPSAALAAPSRTSTADAMPRARTQSARPPSHRRSHVVGDRPSPHPTSHSADPPNPRLRHAKAAPSSDTDPTTSIPEPEDPSHRVISSRPTRVMSAALVAERKQSQEFGFGQHHQHHQQHQREEAANVYRDDEAGSPGGPRSSRVSRVRSPRRVPHSAAVRHSRPSAPTTDGRDDGYDPSSTPNREGPLVSTMRPGASSAGQGRGRSGRAQAVGVAPGARQQHPAGFSATRHGAAHAMSAHPAFQRGLEDAHQQSNSNARTALATESWDAPPAAAATRRPSVAQDSLSSHPMYAEPVTQANAPTTAPEPSRVLHFSPVLHSSQPHPSSQSQQQGRQHPPATLGASQGTVRPTPTDGRTAAQHPMYQSGGQAPHAHQQASQPAHHQWQTQPSTHQQANLGGTVIVSPMTDDRVRHEAEAVREAIVLNSPMNTPRAGSGVGGFRSPLRQGSDLRHRSQYGRVSPNKQLRSTSPRPAIVSLAQSFGDAAIAEDPFPVYAVEDHPNTGATTAVADPGPGAFETVAPQPQLRQRPQQPMEHPHQAMVDDDEGDMLKDGQKKSPRRSDRRPSHDVTQSPAPPVVTAVTQTEEVRVNDNTAIATASSPPSSLFDPHAAFRRDEERHSRHPGHDSQSGDQFQHERHYGKRNDEKSAGDGGRRHQGDGYSTLHGSTANRTAMGEHPAFRHADPVAPQPLHLDNPPRYSTSATVMAADAPLHSSPRMDAVSQTPPDRFGSSHPVPPSGAVVGDSPLSDRVGSPPRDQQDGVDNGDDDAEGRRHATASSQTKPWRPSPSVDRDHSASPHRMTRPPPSPSSPSAKVTQDAATSAEGMPTQTAPEPTQTQDANVGPDVLEPPHEGSPTQLVQPGEGHGFDDARSASTSQQAESLLHENDEPHHHGLNDHQEHLIMTPEEVPIEIGEIPGNDDDALSVEEPPVPATTPVPTPTDATDAAVSESKADETIGEPSSFTEPARVHLDAHAGRPGAPRSPHRRPNDNVRHGEGVSPPRHRVAPSHRPPTEDRSDSPQESVVPPTPPPTPNDAAAEVEPVVRAEGDAAPRPPRVPRSPERCPGGDGGRRHGPGFSVSPPRHRHSSSVPTPQSNVRDDEPVDSDEAPPTPPPTPNDPIEARDNTPTLENEEPKPPRAPRSPDRRPGDSSGHRGSRPGVSPPRHRHGSSVPTPQSSTHGEPPQHAATSVEEKSDGVPPTPPPTPNDGDGDGPTEEANDEREGEEGLVVTPANADLQGVSTNDPSAPVDRPGSRPPTAPRSPLCRPTEGQRQSRTQSPVVPSRRHSASSTPATSAPPSPRHNASPTVAEAIVVEAAEEVRAEEFHQTTTVAGAEGGHVAVHGEGEGDNGEGRSGDVSLHSNTEHNHTDTGSRRSSHDGSGGPLYVVSPPTTADPSPSNRRDEDFGDDEVHDAPPLGPHDPISGHAQPSELPAPHAAPTRVSDNDEARPAGRGGGRSELFETPPRISTSHGAPSPQGVNQPQVDAITAQIERQFVSQLSLHLSKSAMVLRRSNNRKLVARVFSSWLYFTLRQQHNAPPQTTTVDDNGLNVSDVSAALLEAEALRRRDLQEEAARMRRNELDISASEAGTAVRHSQLAHPHHPSRVDPQTYYELTGLAPGGRHPLRAPSAELAAMADEHPAFRRDTDDDRSDTSDHHRRHGHPHRPDDDDDDAEDANGRQGDEGHGRRHSEDGRLSPSMLTHQHGEYGVDFTHIGKRRSNSAGLPLSPNTSKRPSPAVAPSPAPATPRQPIHLQGRLSQVLLTPGPTASKYVVQKLRELHDIRSRAVSAAAVRALQRWVDFVSLRRMDTVRRRRVALLRRGTERRVRGDYFIRWISRVVLDLQDQNRDFKMNAEFLSAAAVDGDDGANADVALESEGRLGAAAAAASGDGQPLRSNSGSSSDLRAVHKALAVAKRRLAASWDEQEQIEAKLVAARSRFASTMSDRRTMDCQRLFFAKWRSWARDQNSVPKRNENKSESPDRGDAAGRVASESSGKESLDKDDEEGSRPSLHTDDNSERLAKVANKLALTQQRLAVRLADHSENAARCHFFWTWLRAASNKARTADATAHAVSLAEVKENLSDAKEMLMSVNTRQSIDVAAAEATAAKLHAQLLTTRSKAASSLCDHATATSARHAFVSWSRYARNAQMATARADQAQDSQAREEQAAAQRKAATSEIERLSSLCEETERERRKALRTAAAARMKSARALETAAQNPMPVLREVFWRWFAAMSARRLRAEERRAEDLRQQTSHGEKSAAAAAHFHEAQASAMKRELTALQSDLASKTRELETSKKNHADATARMQRAHDAAIADATRATQMHTAALKTLQDHAQELQRAEDVATGASRRADESEDKRRLQTEAAARALALSTDRGTIAAFFQRWLRFVSQRNLTRHRLVTADALVSALGRSRTLSGVFRLWGTFAERQRQRRVQIRAARVIASSVESSARRVAFHHWAAATQRAKHARAMRDTVDELDDQRRAEHQRQMDAHTAAATAALEEKESDFAVRLRTAEADAAEAAGAIEAAHARKQRLAKARAAKAFLSQTDLGLRRVVFMRWAETAATRRADQQAALDLAAARDHHARTLEAMTQSAHGRAAAAFLAQTDCGLARVFFWKWRLAASSRATAAAATRTSEERTSAMAQRETELREAARESVSRSAGRAATALLQQSENGVRRVCYWKWFHCVFEVKAAEKVEAAAAQVRATLGQRNAEVTAKDAELLAKDQIIQAKEDALQAKTEDVRTKDEAAATSAAKIATLEAELQSKHTSLQSTDATVNEQAAVMDEQRRTIRRQDDTIKEKDAQLDAQREAVLSRDAVIDMRDAALQAVQVQCQEQETLLQSKDDELRATAATMQDQASAIQEKDTMIGEQAAALQEMTKDAAGRDSDLQTKQRDIAALEARVAQLTETAQAQEAELQAKESACSALKTDLASKEQELAAAISTVRERDATVQSQAAEIQSMMASLEANDRGTKEQQNVIEQLETDRDDQAAAHQASAQRAHERAAAALLSQTHVGARRIAFWRWHLAVNNRQSERELGTMRAHHARLEQAAQEAAATNAAAHAGMKDAHAAVEAKRAEAVAAHQRAVANHSQRAASVLLSQTDLGARRVAFWRWRLAVAHRQAEADNAAAQNDRAAASEEKQRLVERCDAAETERDVAVTTVRNAEADRDTARRERDDAVDRQTTAESERDRALERATAAQADRDAAVERAQNAASAQAKSEAGRNAAAQAAAAAEVERDDALHQKDATEGMLRDAQDQRDAAVDENAALSRAVANAVEELDHDDSEVPDRPGVSVRIVGITGPIEELCAALPPAVSARAPVHAKIRIAAPPIGHDVLSSNATKAAIGRDIAAQLAINASDVRVVEVSEGSIVARVAIHAGVAKSAAVRDGAANLEAVPVGWLKNTAAALEVEPTELKVQRAEDLGPHMVVSYGQSQRGTWSASRTSSNQRGVDAWMAEQLFLPIATEADGDVAAASSMDASTTASMAASRTSFSSFTCAAANAAADGVDAINVSIVNGVPSASGKLALATVPEGRWTNAEVPLRVPGSVTPAVIKLRVFIKRSQSLPMVNDGSDGADAAGVDPEDQRVRPLDDDAVEGVADQVKDAAAADESAVSIAKALEAAVARRKHRDAAATAQAKKAIRALEAGMSADRSAAKEALATKEAKCVEKSTAMTNLQAEVDALNEAVRAAERTAAVANDTGEQETIRADAAERLVIAEEEKVAMVTRALEEVTEQNVSLQAESVELKEKLTEAADEITAMETEMNRLADEVAVLKSTTEDLEKDKDSERVQLIQQIDGLKDTLCDQEQVISTHEADKVAAEKTIEDQSQSLFEATTMNRRLKERTAAALGRAVFGADLKQWYLRWRHCATVSAAGTTLRNAEMALDQKTDEGDRLEEMLRTAQSETATKGDVISSLTQDLAAAKAATAESEERSAQLMAAQRDQMSKRQKDDRRRGQVAAIEALAATSTRETLSSAFLQWRQHAHFAAERTRRLETSHRLCAALAATRTRLIVFATWRSFALKTQKSAIKTRAAKTVSSQTTRGLSLRYFMRWQRFTEGRAAKRIADEFDSTATLAAAAATAALEEKESDFAVRLRTVEANAAEAAAAAEADHARKQRSAKDRAATAFLSETDLGLRRVVFARWLSVVHDVAAARRVRESEQKLATARDHHARTLEAITQSVHGRAAAAFLAQTDSGLTRVFFWKWRLACQAMSHEREAAAAADANASNVFAMRAATATANSRAAIAFLSQGSDGLRRSFYWKWHSACQLRSHDRQLQQAEADAETAHRRAEATSEELSSALQHGATLESSRDSLRRCAAELALRNTSDGLRRAFFSAWLNRTRAAMAHRLRVRAMELLLTSGQRGVMAAAWRRWSLFQAATRSSTSATEQLQRAEAASKRSVMAVKQSVGVVMMASTERSVQRRWFELWRSNAAAREQRRRRFALADSLTTTLCDVRVRTATFSLWRRFLSHQKITWANSRAAVAMLSQTERGSRQAAFTRWRSFAGVRSDGRKFEAAASGHEALLQRCIDAESATRTVTAAHDAAAADMKEQKARVEAERDAATVVNERLLAAVNSAVVKLSPNSDDENSGSPRNDEHQALAPPVNIDPDRFITDPVMATEALDAAVSKASVRSADAALRISDLEHTVDALHVELDAFRVDNENAEADAADHRRTAAEKATAAAHRAAIAFFSQGTEGRRRAVFWQWRVAAIQRRMAATTAASRREATEASAHVEALKATQHEERTAGRKSVAEAHQRIADAAATLHAERAHHRATLSDANHRAAAAFLTQTNDGTRRSLFWRWAAFARSRTDAADHDEEAATMRDDHQRAVAAIRSDFVGTKRAANNRAAAALLANTDRGLRHVSFLKWERFVHERRAVAQSDQVLEQHAHEHDRRMSEHAERAQHSAMAQISQIHQKNTESSTDAKHRAARALLGQTQRGLQHFSFWKWRCAAMRFRSEESDRSLKHRAATLLLSQTDVGTRRVMYAVWRRFVQLNAMAALKQRAAVAMGQQVDRSTRLGSFLRWQHEVESRLDERDATETIGGLVRDRHSMERASSDFRAKTALMLLSLTFLGLRRTTFLKWQFETERKLRERRGAAASSASGASSAARGRVPNDTDAARGFDDGAFVEGRQGAHVDPVSKLAAAEDPSNQSAVRNAETPGPQDAATLEAKLRSVQAEAQELKRAAESVAADSERRTAENERLQAKVVELEQDMAILQTAHGDSNSKIQQLERELALAAREDEMARVASSSRRTEDGDDDDEAQATSGRSDRNGRSGRTTTDLESDENASGKAGTMRKPEPIFADPPLSVDDLLLRIEELQAELALAQDQARIATEEAEKAESDLQVSLLREADAAEREALDLERRCAAAEAVANAARLKAEAAQAAAEADTKKAMDRAAKAEARASIAETNAQQAFGENQRAERVLKTSKAEADQVAVERAMAEASQAEEMKAVLARAAESDRQLVTTSESLAVLRRAAESVVADGYEKASRRTVDQSRRTSLLSGPGAGALPGVFSGGASDLAATRNDMSEIGSPGSTASESSARAHSQRPAGPSSLPNHSLSHRPGGAAAASQYQSAAATAKSSRAASLIIPNPDAVMLHGRPMSRADHDQAVEGMTVHDLASALSGLSPLLLDSEGTATSAAAHGKSAEEVRALERSARRAEKKAQYLHKGLGFVRQSLRSDLKPAIKALRQDVATHLGARYKDAKDIRAVVKTIDGKHQGELRSVRQEMDRRVREAEFKHEEFELLRRQAQAYGKLHLEHQRLKEQVEGMGGSRRSSNAASPAPSVRSAR